MDGFGEVNRHVINKQVPVVSASSLAPNASSARPPMVVILEPNVSVEQFESKLREECTSEVELVVHSLKSRHGVVVEQTGRAVITPQFVGDFSSVIKVLTPEGEFRKIPQQPLMRAPVYVPKPKPSLTIGTIFDDLLSSGNETEGEEESEVTTSAAPLTEAEREELARQQQSREKNAAKRAKKKQQKRKNKPGGNKGKEISGEFQGWFW